jgi:NADPH:quinone reductase-like Zn-dependent oxidoreductase
MMKAIVLKDFGSVDNFQIKELPMPGIKDDEVLVEVKAISINPVDVKTRSGKGLAAKLKEFNPVILGWDIAGVVADIGSSVTNFKKGDEVFGMVNFPGYGKAYAEFVAVPAAHLAIKPENSSFEAAAAATLAALTAWQAIEALKIKAGDRFLVHAAAGGVGHFAVQIGKYLGAYLIGTASAHNKNFLISLGTDEFVDYKAQPLDEVISNVDKVLDAIGGENIDLSLKLMKPGGAILSLPSGKNEDVQEKATARGMTGIRMLVQSSGEGEQIIAELITKGVIKPHVSKIFSFEQMKEAHLQVESGKTVGKIIIKVQC